MLTLIRSSLALAVLAICSACADRPTSPNAGSVSSIPALASINVPEDTGFVLTPIGVLPAGCVHLIPRGDIADEGNRVTRADGASYQLAKCTAPSMIFAETDVQRDVIVIVQEYSGGTGQMGSMNKIFSGPVF